MGWMVLHKSTVCDDKCEHKDCAETRRMAGLKCAICDEEIGYDNGFYTRDFNNDILVHTLCAWEEAEIE